MVRVRSLCIPSNIGSAHTQTLTSDLQYFHTLTQYPILSDPRMSFCTYTIPHSHGSFSSFLGSLQPTLLSLRVDQRDFNLDFSNTELSLFLDLKVSS